MPGFLGDVETAHFHAGDGINHLQCDSRQGIWVGYFDEGDFGDTIGHHGVVRFGRNGEVRSYYAGHDIADCYAQNVGQSATWSCWYDNFPLVKFGDDFSEVRWTNDLASGISAIAANAPHVLLVGDYKNRNSLALARMHNDGLKLLRTFDARETLGVDLTEVWFTARNDNLHVVVGDRWLTAPLGHFVAMAS